MSKYGAFFGLFLAMYVQGCSANDNKSVTLRFSPPELVNPLLMEMNRRNIHHKHDGGVEITFFESDMDEVMSLSDQLMNEILPRERSFSPATEELLSCYVAEFGKKNVAYEIKTVDDSKWIVLDSEHFDKYHSLCSLFD